jgi:hypothetical protein
LCAPAPGQFRNARAKLSARGMALVLEAAGKKLSAEPMRSFDGLGMLRLPVLRMAEAAVLAEHVRAAQLSLQRQGAAEAVLFGHPRDLAFHGSSAEEAKLVADHLVLANLFGHDSHGVGMMPAYIQNTTTGRCVRNHHAKRRRRFLGVSCLRRPGCRSSS